LKTILVTGASSGIGRALAVRAARAGYSVYAVGRNMKALAALGAQVNEEGGTIRTDVTDVSEPTNAPGLIGRMVAAFGQVDVLVNNAGAVAVGPIAAQSDEDLRVQFGTHVIGPLALVREALPSLRATSGHVFMLGSGVARVPVGGLGAYPPSKAALRSATSILRRELVPLDIAVTYVDPGAVDTVFMSRAGMPGAPPSMLVSPELVARKILFAIGTRPNVLNVAPLQTAAVAVAEILPALTDAILTRNPSLIGSGPQIALDTNGRWEKIALPASKPLPAAPPEPPEPAGAATVEAATVEVEDFDDDLADDDLADDDLADDALVDDVPDVTAEPVVDEADVDVDVDVEPFAAEIGSPEDVPAAEAEPPEVIPTATVVAAAEAEPRPARWSYEPPEADDAVLVERAPEPVVAEIAPVAAVAPPAKPVAPAEPLAAAPKPVAEAPREREPFTMTPRIPEEELFAEPEEAQAGASDDEPAHATSSYDAALEPLRNRMQRAKLTPQFVRDLLVADAVLDVGETAMRWAGMPNKHERALTSEVFFALAEWGFLAPRADGRYRVIKAPDAGD
jgi:short-subunit dehydrogenase